MAEGTPAPHRHGPGLKGSLQAGQANRAQRRHPATYTADEFAALLGVSLWSLYESVRRGDPPIPPIRVGRRLVWPRSAVNALLGIDGAGE